MILSQPITIKSASFTLMGIALPNKTSNANGQSSIDCGKLWTRFTAEDIHSKIGNRMDDHVYAVYYDYDGDHTQPFRYFIGCQVKEEAPAENGLQKLRIPQGGYIQVTAKGKMPDCIADAWQEIWESKLPRSYRFDFEVYGPQSVDWNNAIVPIHLS